MSFGSSLVTVDFNSNPTYYTVRDVGPTSVLISDTSKPVSPTFTYTVQAGDVPTGTTGVASFGLLFAVGGFNSSENPESLQWRFTLNGSDINSFDAFISLDESTGTNPYWAALGNFMAAAINVGDVIGIKLWASTTNVVDYRYYNIYVIPRQTPPVPNNTLLYVLYQNVFYVQGAIAGVSYPVQARYAPQMAPTDDKGQRYGGDTPFAIPKTWTVGYELSNTNDTAPQDVGSSQFLASISATRYLEYLS